MKPAPGAFRFHLGTVDSLGLAAKKATMEFLANIRVASSHDWVTHLSSTAIQDLNGRGYYVVAYRTQLACQYMTWIWLSNLEQATGICSSTG